MTTSDRSGHEMSGKLRAALAQRVVVADGAMGTMLQASPVTLGDFDGHEGCNEILNLTRPDVVRSIHDAYLAAGVDCITTNTFGANLGNLGEYGLQARTEELSEAGARIARAAADAASTGSRPRWVLGSVGPGTKLPTPGHVRFADLRDAYPPNVTGLPPGGGAGAFRRRVRARPGGRLLRHHSRAPGCAGGPRAGQAAHPPAATAGARCRLALPACAVPPGHLVPRHRRAHQRERVEGVPRGA